MSSLQSFAWVIPAILILGLLAYLFMGSNVESSRKKRNRSRREAQNRAFNWDDGQFSSKKPQPSRVKVPTPEEEQEFWSSSNWRD